jgi:transcriptional regulator with PAS, ATPase and Fis domain
MPPLRERQEDIPLLVAYFVDRYARKAGKTIRNLDGRTLEILQSYAWPGNVRELQNVIERSLIVCETETLASTRVGCVASLTRRSGRFNRSPKSWSLGRGR